MKRPLSPQAKRDALDVTLAVLAVAISVSTLLSVDQRTPLDAPAWWLAMAHALPIAVRRRWPGWAFAASGVAGLVFIALGYPMVVLGVTALLMAYTLAAERRRVFSLPGLTAAGLGMVIALRVAGSDTGADTIAGNLVVLAAAWLIGDSARRRRDQAEAERVALARQAVAEERLRIARELHDVVAHSMSVVGVQAGLARMVIDDDPGQAKESLSAIETAGRQAMEELRRLLHVMRDEGDGGADFAPARGLADLAVLVTDSNVGGSPVVLSEHGVRRELNPGLDLAAYRVVQEALTNVRRHAPGSAAVVTISYEDADLVLQIDNPAPDGAPAGINGHGLTGMRERVELYRGRMESGLRPDGTFRVLARLPYQGGA